MTLLAPPSLPVPGARRGVPTSQLYSYGSLGSPNREAELRLVAEALGDAYAAARRIAREDGPGFVGYGLVELRDGDDELAQLDVFANKITTVGDQYYAQKGIVSVQPANFTSPPAVASGMKLGTGTTAATKSGAAAGLVTYITGSNNPFDSGFPTTAAAGTDIGWNATYKTSWAAGDVTNSAIAEATICNDAATDTATGTVAATYARAVISTVNKTASDSLAITWTHTLLGA